MSLRTVVMLGAVLLAGCDSSSSGRADSGSDGPASDRARAGDATTGSASDSKSGRTDSSDALAGQSALEVCEAVISAQADQAQRCSGGPVYYSFTDCPGRYFGPDSNRSVAAIAGCLDEFAKLPCTDWNLGIRTACLVGGKRPAGAGCLYSSQCESGHCSSHVDSCGVCNPIAALGDKCGQDNRCEGGSFCHPKTGVCTSSDTIVHAGAGEACDLVATPVIGCELGLICDTGDAHKFAGTCRPAPSAGQPCASTRYTSLVCASGTRCSAVDNGTCLAPGACGSKTCDADSYCQESTMACVPLANVGEACSTPVPDYVSPCVSPAICRSGKCVSPGAAGDSCDADHPCQDYRECVDGVCQDLVCPA